MRATIHEATLRDTTFVGANMRDVDWSEIGCQVPDWCSKSDAAAICFETSVGSCWTAWLDDEIIAAFGFAWSGNPVLGSAWAFGTDRMRRVMPAISRHCTIDAMPRLFARGWQRVEVRVSIDHHESVRWLELMGARCDCELKSFGKNGENFYLMSWTRDCLPQKYLLDYELEAAA